MVRGKGERMTFYICNPSIYEKCPKTLCQEKCRLTTHKEYAEKQWGEPLIAYAENEPLEKNRRKGRTNDNN